MYHGDALDRLVVVAENNDDGDVKPSRLVFLATAGVAYSIAVDGFYSGTLDPPVPASGNLLLHWESAVQSPVIIGFEPDHGPVGTPVTLTGVNLEGVLATRVRRPRPAALARPRPCAGSATGPGVDNYMLFDDYRVALARDPQPLMVVEPANQTVDLGQPAVFAVAVHGAEPLVYEWLKDGQVLPNSTGPALVFNATDPADAGKYPLAEQQPWADANRDGWSNAGEYALGTRPDDPTSRPQPAAELTEIGGVPHFVISFTPNPAARDLSFSAEFSLSLDPPEWSETGVTEISVGPPRVLGKAIEPGAYGGFLRLNVHLGE